MQFCIDKMQAMDAALVTKIIQRWRTEEHPSLCRYFDYYMGNQAILRKHYPCTPGPHRLSIRNGKIQTDFQC